jgi:hypothetical protein
MMDFWFYVFAFGLTAAIAGVWCICAELFKRWLNNDWCRHDWGMWDAIMVEQNTIIYRQNRFCKKCNKAEKRIL